MTMRTQGDPADITQSIMRVTPFARLHSAASFDCPQVVNMAPMVPLSSVRLAPDTFMHHCYYLLRTRCGKKFCRRCRNAHAGRNEGTKHSRDSDQIRACGGRAEYERVAEEPAGDDPSCAARQYRRVRTRRWVWNAGPSANSSPVAVPNVSSIPVVI